MFVFPDDKPVICGIRSIYVRTPILIKYYQEQIDAGCIYFHNGKAECVLFFDNRNMVACYFHGPNQELEGETAVAHVSQNPPPYDFSIDIYEIPGEQLILWSGMQGAKPIHSNLSTEFTDLKKLIVKLAGQNLTGYIDIHFTNNQDHSRIFLAGGKLMGGVYSSMGSKLSRNKEHFDDLINKTSEFEGVFNVYRVEQRQAAAPQEVAPTSPAPVVIPESSILALEEFLLIAASVIGSDKRIKGDFATLVKKKFVENADRYPFLDPFAGEFTYQAGKIRFTGEADEILLATGVIFSIMSVMEENHLTPAFHSRLTTWKNTHAEHLTRWSIHL